jgi:signal transduction histidine kinase
VRWLRVALVPAGLVLGVAAESVSAYGSGGLDTAAGDLAVGWVLLACGLVGWGRRGRSLVGPLLAAAGVAWFVGNFWTAALFLYRGPLVHALLVFPGARLRRPLGRLAVAAAYLDGAIEPLGASPVVTIVLCAAIAVAAIDGYVGDVGPRRRARLVATAGATALALVLGFSAVGRLAGWDVEARALWAFEVTLVVVALVLLGDLLRGRWWQGAVTGLVIDLGELREPVSLRDRLARALGDSSLELGWWLGAERGYVDEAGRPFAPPDAGEGRAVTPIESQDGHVAVLVHDRAVLEDPALVEAVAAATRMAVGNVHLQAEVQGRVERLAASRRRIVEAADAQRRQLERELHDGAERRLAAVSAHVEALAHDIDEPGAQQLLGDVETQIGAARAELSELGRGIHPSALTTGGLSAALAQLASRAPVPVELRVDAGRFAPAVEAAAYFVCAEALTNVAKYASASCARIESHRDAGRLVVEIVDDGVGGADPSRGSGLRGLADRVEALGGRLSVQSAAGPGTRVVAEIPAE